MGSQRIGYGAIANLQTQCAENHTLQESRVKANNCLIQKFLLAFVIEYLPLEIQMMKSFNLVVWLNCYQIVLRATYFIYPCCFLDAK